MRVCPCEILPEGGAINRAMHHFRQKFLRAKTFA